MNTINTLIIVALIGSIQIVQAQDDNPDLYDIAGEFAYVRIQYDSYYDNFDTGRLQLNHRLNKMIIFRSSIGSGYRAPTASQLFNKTYGNKKLKPEKSLSTDVSTEINIPSLSSNLYIELLFCIKFVYIIASAFQSSMKLLEYCLI